MKTGMIMISLLLAGNSSMVTVVPDPSLGPEAHHEATFEARPLEGALSAGLDNTSPPKGVPPENSYTPWPSQVWQYQETIYQTADYYQMPPEVVAAIIWRESGGNPASVSRVGAIGLMGIMPGYHQCASFNPEANIWCGAGILALFTANASGDLRSGLAAYNAGETGRDQNGKGWDYARLVLRIAKGFGYRQ
jgi:soluble lytic murein transglycosylase-like protein